MLPCVQGASTARSEPEALVRFLSASPHMSDCHAGPASPWLSPRPAERPGTGACSVGCRHLSNEAPPLLSSDCAELWELNMALASRLNAPNIRPETQLLTLICAESY